MNDHENMHFKNNPVHHQRNKISPIFISGCAEPPRSARRRFAVGLRRGWNRAPFECAFQKLNITKRLSLWLWKGVTASSTLSTLEWYSFIKNQSRYRSKKATPERSSVSISAAALTWPQCRDKAEWIITAGLIFNTRQWLWWRICTSNSSLLPS